MIGVAAAVPWPCTPSAPLVKEVNTLPEKRNTVNTKAPASPAAAVRKLLKMASAFIADPGASIQALAATWFERTSASTSIERPSLSSEEHTPELQSLMRLSYVGFCLKKKKT